MTKIQQTRVLTERHLMVRDAVAIIATLAAVASMWLVYQVARPHMDDSLEEARIRRILKASCAFPYRNGEATTWAVGGDGLLNCWEQRDKSK